MSYLYKKQRFYKIILGLCLVSLIQCKKNLTSVDKIFDKYYYYNDKKVGLVIVDNFVGIGYINNITQEEAFQLNDSYGLSRPEVNDWNELEKKWFIVPIPEGHSYKEYLTTYGKHQTKIFGNEDKVEFCTPVLYLVSDNGEVLTDKKITYNDLLMVQFHGGNIRENDIKKLVEDYNMIILEPDPDNYLNPFEYTLKVTKMSPFDALDMANHFYEEYREFVIWISANKRGGGTYIGK